MNRKFARILSCAAIAALSASAFASPITPGDLVIYRVGDGTQSLVNTGNSVFLDEYTTSGTLVQSIAMPTTASGSNVPLVSSGTATSEGMITVSPDSQFIALAGYDSTLPGGSSLGGTTGATVNRTVGIFNTLTGTVDTSTHLSNFADGNNPRGAYTSDGTNIWVTGGAGGVRFTTLGSTGASSTQLSTTVTNLRSVNAFGGQLYVSDSSGSAVRIGSVGSGLPTTSGQTITNLPGFVTSGSPYGFVLEDLTSSVAGFDTLYVAEDTTGGGQIQKYSLVSGAWTLNGTIAAAGVRGLTASSGGSTVYLFGTTGGSSAAGGGSLYDATDTAGYNAAPSVSSAVILATAGANEAFRGIVWVPEPSTLGALAAAAMMLVRRRQQA